MTQVASHRHAMTRLGALVRAARDSRPLTSLSGDQLTMALSGLCLVHCLASAVFFASIASVGGALLNPVFHEVGLIVAIGFALVMLVSGVLSHGYMMPFGVGCFGLGVMAGALFQPPDGSGVVGAVIGGALVAPGGRPKKGATRG